MTRATMTLLATLCLATAAQAEGVAQLTGLTGTVLVNAGEGFIAAGGADPIMLKPGDRVLLKEDSTATVTYAECSFALAKPALFTVSKTAPCAKAGEGVNIIPANAGTQNNDDTAGGFPLEAGLVAGAAVIAGAAIFLLDDDDNDNNAVTPN